MEEVAPFKMERIQTDNGSEFEHHFRDYVKEKNIIHYHNYPKSPKMNAFVERFNRTIQEEFVDFNMQSLAYDIDSFNGKLINWLLWYNTKRPHHSLKMISPMQFIINNLFLTPQKSRMYWTHTPTDMIFITGPHSAGKTTIAGYLKDLGFLHIETGDIVRKKYQEEAPGIEFHSWASSQHQRFNRFIADAAMDSRSVVEESHGRFQDILIIGNRQASGIDYLLQNVPPLDGKPSLIIFVEADEQILFRRHAERPGRCPEGMTFEKFKEDVLGFDTRMGLKEIRSRANLIVCNEGRIGNCVDCVTSFLESSGYVFPKQTDIEGHFGNTERR